MAQIADDIEQKFKEALKNKDTFKISVLRLAKSALVNARIAKMSDLSHEEEIAVIRREVKKRQEAAEAFEQGGNTERAIREREEAEYLKTFLPQEMGDEQIRAVVSEVIKEQGITSSSDFGKVMGAVMKRLGGRVSGERVSKIVKEELAKF